jgi:hypothetical protein
MWLKSAWNRLTSTPTGGWFALALIVIGVCGIVAVAFALLDLVDVWVLKAGLLFLASFCWFLHGRHPMKHEAFKWRKRWLIERFGVGVEGQEGDYFVTTSYSIGIPCIMFAARREDLKIASQTVRQWSNLMGGDPLGENCDMPDEKALGLPEDPSKDNRPWVAAGPGLCLVPPALVERAMKRPSAK